MTKTKSSLNAQKNPKAVDKAKNKLKRLLLSNGVSRPAAQITYTDKLDLLAKCSGVTNQNNIDVFHKKKQPKSPNALNANSTEPKNAAASKNVHNNSGQQGKKSPKVHQNNKTHNHSKGSKSDSIKDHNSKIQNKEGLAKSAKEPVTTINHVNKVVTPSVLKVKVPAVLKEPAKAIISKKQNNDALKLIKAKSNVERAQKEVFQSISNGNKPPSVLKETKKTVKRLQKSKDKTLNKNTIAFAVQNDFVVDDVKPISGQSAESSNKGFIVDDISTNPNQDCRAIVARSSMDDRTEYAYDSDFSMGSSPEEISTDGESYEFSDDASDGSDIDVSAMQRAYTDFVNSYIENDGSNESDDSNDSCPELIPIDAEKHYDSDDSSFGTEYSCECSDCSGYTECSGEEGEEEENSSDDEWSAIGSDDYENYSSTDADSCPDLVEIADPHFFETDREPLVIWAGQSSQNAWAKLPLDLNESVTVHNDSIELIVESVGRDKPKPPKRPIATSTLAKPVELPEPLTPIKKDNSCVDLQINYTNWQNEKPSLPKMDTNSPDDHSFVNQLEIATNGDSPDQLDQTEYDPIDETLPKTSKRPRFFNSLDSQQVLLVLKSELHFHGIINVTLLAGNTNIYGYALQPNKAVTAYSPRGHSYISLAPVRPAANATDADKAALLDSVQRILTGMQSGFITHDIYGAIESFDATNDSLLLLRPADDKQNGVNMIGKYMRQIVFPNANTFNQRGGHFSTEYILRCKFFQTPKTRLLLSPQWQAVDFAAHSRTVVIGGKNVGKSTFVRYLTNACVQKYGRALLIDLDIGQPEVFVPQTISATCLSEPILGPGYLQSKVPAHALLFGEINVTVAPLKYLRCVFQLLRWCGQHPEYSRMPWIVNTMGYNKGFGPELIAAILRSFRFSDLVQIQSQRQLDNFDQVMRADLVNGYTFNFFHVEVGAAAAANMAPPKVTYRTHVFRSMARKFGDKTNDWDMSAKDTRFAIVLSHLGALLKDGCEWITDVEPVCASLNDIKVIVSSEAVAEDQRLRLLNGNLVYLCKQTADDEADIVECLGIGIVRAVDLAENNVYLLPATTADRLAATNALAVCNTPLPTSLITNHNRRVKGRIPYVYSTDDFIGSKHVVRIAYRPDFTPKK